MLGLGKKKTYSGFTPKTTENLILDAGAFFLNFDMKTDTFEKAVTAGKLLGATRGGGQFSAVPEIRDLPVDGVKGKGKGLQVIDGWEVKIGANVLEITKDVIRVALGVSTQEESEENDKYDVIRAKNHIELADYIDNVTYVGRRSGSNEPLIIQVYNTLNKNGLTMQTQDKGEVVIALDLEGHYGPEDLDSPPFAIFYPKAAAVVENQPVN